MKRTDELDLFKLNINLSHYAASKGYELDSKISSRNCAIMRQGHDKIAIALNQNGHWMYFSVTDDHDNGTIIDFVQNRFNLNLGEVRKELRPWLSETFPDSLNIEKNHPPRLDPIKKDIARLRACFSAMEITERSSFLENHRKIPVGTLQNERFLGKIHRDKRGNTIFVHSNLEGICGYEIKNKDFTGFSPGGEKGVWHSNLTKSDLSLVIGESGIDILSYATLHPESTARYMSLGGSLNDNQPILVQRSIEKMPLGAKIVLAMDNDKGGKDIIQRIYDELPASLIADREILEDLPPEQGMDWNDMLHAAEMS